MGLNVIKSFIRTVRNGANVTDVKCDPGGGAISTKEHSSAPGDDSFPLLTDIAISVPVPGSGKEAVVGYLDPLNEAGAESGEKRIYSRQADGTIVADVFLKNDGTIVAENDNAVLEISPDGSAILTNGPGVFSMQVDGTFDINGLTITPAGEIVTALGVDLDTHTHAQANDSASDTQANTGPPL